MLILTSADERQIETLVNRMKRQAASGLFDGRVPSPYLARCHHTHMLGISATYSRDVGYHTSGWWKNPDYERCRHLSLAFFEPESMQFTGQKNDPLTRLMVDAIFGVDRRWLWCEPPYSDEGKRKCVWHYRLFCDQGWQPICPRGEVYGRELIEAGWLSYSDVQFQKESAREN
jgi:hypothetical protein